MTSNIFIFITNIFIPLVSLHAALKDFLFRFPTTLWILSILGLVLILLVKLTTKNENESKLSSYKTVLLLLIPLGLFSAFLEVGQTPTTKLQFQSFHKFLSYFEAQRQKINFNTELINYYQKAYSSPLKPASGAKVSDNSFRVLFKEKETIVKEASLSPSDIMDMCQIISTLRVREIFENLKNSVDVTNLTKLTLEDVLSMKKMCIGSANYQFLLSIVNDINSVRSLQPNSTEFITIETGIYNKLSALPVKSFFNNMPGLSDVKFSTSSLLSVGSTGDVTFYEATTDITNAECKKIIVDELGYGDLIPYQVKRKATNTHSQMNLYYPIGMFSPIYLLDNDHNKILILNVVNESQRTFCFIIFEKGEVNIKLAEVII